MFGRKKIGIALSGGAARGLSHIGVLQVLEDLGVEIRSVSGCSMGAIVGAVYSLGTDLKEMERFIKSNDWKSFLLFSMFALSRNGIMNMNKVDEILKKFLQDKTFDDCKREFCCVAVDLIKGEKVIINKGSLREAVRASIAVPGIIPPVYKGDKLLVDGGIMEPLPTEAMSVLHSNFIIASSIVFESDKAVTDKQDNRSKHTFTKNHVKNREIRKMSIQAIIDKSFNLMHAQMVKSYTEKADIVIEPKIGDYGFFDFAKGMEIIDCGRRAAIEKTPEIKRRLRIV